MGSFFSVLYKIYSAVRDVIVSWSFFSGFFIAVAILSRYIFGDDNLIEETVELLDQIATGEDVDFSPESVEKPGFFKKLSEFIKEIAFKV